MRDLCQIIEMVKDGGRPEYDELRYALLAVDALLTFANNDVKKLLKEPVSPLVKALVKSDNPRRLQIALNKDPKAYVGSWDPDAPGRQEEREMHKRVFGNIMQKIEEKENGI